MVNFLDGKIANLTLIKNLTLTTPFFPIYGYSLHFHILAALFRCHQITMGTQSNALCLEKPSHLIDKLFH